MAGLVEVAVVGEDNGAMGVPAGAAEVESAAGVVVSDAAGVREGTEIGGMVAVAVAVAATSEASVAGAKPAL